jgi:hypothetical protein
MRSRILRRSSSPCDSPVEDLQDHHGAVHHLGAHLLRQVERLRGRNLVIDQHDFGAVFEDFLFEFFPLAGAEVGRGLEAGALLGERVDDLEAERLRELAQFR